MRRIFAASLVLGVMAMALPAHALPGDDAHAIIPSGLGEPAPSYTPWLPNTYESPRGLPQHVHIPPPARSPRHLTRVPPPMYVPQTGQTLPNLQTASGSGRGGAETYQDRAVRCAHQASAYGSRAGDPDAYVGACINQ
jgi:hypothetical protein